MPTRTLALRYVAVLALSLWIGGFTFYSAFVIPELHEVLGTVSTGAVTRRVTGPLNLIGLAAVTCWWLLVVVEGGVGSRGSRRARVALLSVTTLLLLFLIVLHRVMDQRLDAGSLRGFYALHRAYLLASTAQWVASLGLLYIALGREASELRY